MKPISPSKQVDISKEYIITIDKTVDLTNTLENNILEDFTFLNLTSILNIDMMTSLLKILKYYKIEC